METWYGYPLPFVDWAHITDASGATIRWDHRGPNYPLAVSLILAIWSVGPVVLLAVRHLRRTPLSASRWPARLQYFACVAFSTGVCGIIAAVLALTMFGWSLFVLDIVSPPQPVWQVHSYVRDHLFGLHRKLGLQAGWPAYSILTAIGMGTGLVAGVAPAWLSARGAKRQST